MSEKPLSRQGAKGAKNIVLIALVLAATASGQSAALPRPPAVTSTAAALFARGEVLNYNVNWPSGLSLGEATMKAGGGDSGWSFEFTIDASLPAFAIKDNYYSTADAQFCSERLEKESTHGTRKAKETVTYDQRARRAQRETNGGGKSEVSIGECTKDALTFLYFLRRELSLGRVPPAQALNFGSQYQVTATYSGTRQVEIGGAQQPADRVVVSFRGPSSSHTFEILFSRDAARTPLVIRVPFSLGDFSLELVR
jgi:hypothetical protein